MLFRSKALEHLHSLFPKAPMATDEELAQIALLYKRKIDFKRGHPYQYWFAVRRRLIDKICSHMPICSVDSIAEEELFGIILTVFPNARKLRDRRVNISGKPHIHGFDIDIFIPELSLGIEYDGKHWHSFKGLRRSRKHWPDEDIHNYHKIKDSWFLDNGIQILHIKEVDWIKDKQACIDKCLEFLKQKEEPNV